MSVDKKDLRVFATLTEQSALELGGDNPDLAFTTDKKSIVFAGKIFTLNESQRTWVANKIREEIEQNCSISISISPTSGINGESQRVNITVKLYYKGALTNMVEGTPITDITCTNGSSAITLSETSLGTYQGILSVTATTTFTASATMYGVVKTATAKYSTFYPSWYGKVETSSVASNSDVTQLKSLLTYVTKDLTGSTNTLTVSNSNQYLWVLVPKTSKIINVLDASTGFGVSMRYEGDYEITLNSIRAIYSVFRSYNGVSALNKVTISFT